MNKHYPYSNYKNYRESKNPYYEKFKNFSSMQDKPTGLLDENTEQYRGSWRKFFGKPENSFLQLELGAYHGESALHLARANPKDVFLGVEWKFKQCFKAAKKTKDRALDNLCFLRANMSRIPWVVKPGEVDRIWILFPDPWSKASHQKHRVLHPGFFRILGALLNEGKELMIKTDHAEYAEYIQKSIAEAACFSPMSQELATKIWAELPPTPFEKIFMRQGAKIHAFSYLRNQNLVVPPMEVQEILPVSSIV